MASSTSDGGTAEEARALYGRKGAREKRTRAQSAILPLLYPEKRTLPNSPVNDRGDFVAADERGESIPSALLSIQKPSTKPLLLSPTH